MTSSVKDLREYLQIVWDMESNLYAQNRLSTELHNKLKNTQLLAYPEQPSKPKVPQKSAKEKGGIVLLLLGIIGAIAAYKIFYLDDDSLPRFFVEHPSLLGVPWLGLCAASAFAILSGIGVMISRILTAFENKRSAQKMVEDMELYKKKLNTWQDEMIRTKIKNNSLQAEQAVLQANIDAVEKQFSSSLLMLNELYSANIIHPKYRNLSAVSSLYEYIDTGRCFQLEGPTGAYNLLENEMRLDRILIKLDQVIEKLDSIREFQFDLYTAITEGNRRTESLLESVARDVEHVSASGQETATRLSNIEATGKIIEYNTERTRKELEYYNRMRYRLGDYNKVGDNQRP